ncbi:TetR/AcrR family transcriptional regulator [Naasia lichenicola]|uniref:TetR/AcrR family transcriptional regulator n=1 Tax=Naasia lichenicola TaxID=2565933 RepID=A0A4S4FMA6_9MICO|nr:TetR/AcrR family transcriptional regulator [Naasia lichenicola]THG31630.1 TetR/AcrR family transcriptional regulator [Naasia lichenicola]
MSTGNGYAPGRARQQQILAEATRAFGRGGFDGVSVQEIAEACGISRQGLLHHFGSKEGLLMALLRQRDGADEELFRQTMSESGSPFRAIVAVTRANAATPGITAMFTQLAAEAIRPEHPAHDFFRGVYTRIHQDLRGTLADMQRRGTLVASVDPDQLASGLIALRDGLALQLFLRSETQSADEMTSTLETMFSLLVAQDPEHA